MQNLRFTIAAGETKVFEIAGRYLEIIDATGPIDIGLYDRNGSQADDGKGLLSGTYMETAYSKFELTSASAQTIELFLTDTRGGTRRQPGNVRVIDEITDAILNAPLNMPTPIVALTWVPLVAPAANMKGCIIRYFTMAGAAGVGGLLNMQLVACKSMPTSYLAPAQRYSIAAKAATNGGAIDLADNKLNKLLPPGWGIYAGYEITGAAATNGAYTVGSELL